MNKSSKAHLYVTLSAILAAVVNGKWDNLDI